jgi:hypothetical protein
MNLTPSSFNREIIDPRREGADEVPKGYSIVEQTRAHHFRYADLSVPADQMTREIL